MAKQPKGRRLIKIEVLDLTGGTAEEGEDSENVILSAQYVVSDPIDSIMDQTENLVNKISKSMFDIYSL